MQSAHYERLASSYNDLWAHGPAFLEWMTSQTLDRLELEPDDRVADIGGGTGLFCHHLATAADLDNPVLCVDPSQPMLDELPADPRVVGLRASMEELADGSVSLRYGELDAIVLKEVIHHADDPATTLSRLAGLLRPGGRILVITLPPRLNYPLFRAALDRFATTQPEPEDLGNALTATGLEVDLSLAEFNHTYPADWYLDRVRARCMSVLSSFTDDEIESGVEEIRAAYPEDTFEFVDRFAFVSGHKPR